MVKEVNKWRGEMKHIVQEDINKKTKNKKNSNLEAFLKT